MSSSNNQKLAVFPTRMTLTLMKTRLKGAQNGYSLLKRKSEALTKRFREITGKLAEAKKNMGKVMQDASFSYAEVLYAAGEIGFQVRENVKQARFKIRSRQENVSGVILPVFEKWVETGTTSNLTGLGRGGQQVQKCRDAYQKAVESLIDIASLQTAFVILDEVIKMTNRRVNSLEYIVIPRIENTIKYIQSELDEMDREEFFRLKKVQGKKKITKDLEEIELLAAGIAKAKIEGKVEETAEMTGAVKDLLFKQDEDIIF